MPKVVEAYLAVRPTDRGDALFVGQRGPLGARGIQLRIAALGEAAGVAVTPHVLRHTFATRLLREVKTDPSGDLRTGLVTVAALLGHSSVATTAIYQRSWDLMVTDTQPNAQDLSAAVAGLA